MSIDFQAKHKYISEIFMISKAVKLRQKIAFVETLLLSFNVNVNFMQLLIRKVLDINIGLVLI